MLFRPTSHSQARRNRALLSGSASRAAHTACLPASERVTATTARNGGLRPRAWARNNRDKPSATGPRATQQAHPAA
jgi:hypothetical protein